MRGFALLVAAALGFSGMMQPASAAPAAQGLPQSAPTPPDAASAAAVRAGVDAWSAGNYEAAVKAWQAPAAKGDADALFNLGQAYKLGRGVNKDLVRAEAYFGKAARLGHIAAADNYGILLFQTNRHEAAMPWLESAADRGEPRAMYVLGIAAYNGDYAPKDWVRAYALMTRAAAAGLAQATGSLATMNQTIPLAQRQMGVSLASELEQKAADARGRELAAADLGGQGAPVRTAPAPKAPPGAIEKVDLPPSSHSEPAVAYLPPPMEPAATPKPKPVPVKPAAPKPAPPKPAPAAPASASGNGAYRIQLGAFGVKANADALWARVRGRPEIAGHARQDLPGSATRLLATGYSQDGAVRACAALKAGGFACLAVAP
ncbi:SPOR domain-containing protein [Novosphingobium sp.]|uniref:SPOR domain-containing protein n=1 Tax=Novosphingobium sp. TaxID=1874826 RepID=UPI002613AC17|nr:SPOR domain-containing protein [Novosphingobium sp.]